ICLVNKPLLASSLPNLENCGQKNGIAQANPSPWNTYIGVGCMEILYSDCAGMDVHRESIVVCVLHTNEEGDVLSETRTFGTLTKQLFELLQWLESRTVTHVAMESTGIYWKPVYNIL